MNLEPIFNRIREKSATNAAMREAKQHLFSAYAALESEVNSSPECDEELQTLINVRDRLAVERAKITECDEDCERSLNSLASTINERISDLQHAGCYSSQEPTFRLRDVRPLCRPWPHREYHQDWYSVTPERCDDAGVLGEGPVVAAERLREAAAHFCSLSVRRCQRRRPSNATFPRECARRRCRNRRRRSRGAFWNP